MSVPGSIIEKGGKLYRVDQETYTYYDTVVSEKTRTDYTGFDDVAICRPKLLYFKAVGLRPNTRHFVYFDKVDVSNYINTSISNVTEFRTLARNDPKRNPGEKYIKESGFPTELGGPTTPILSDASGTIEGVFYLQSNNILNFPAGRRIMSFIDINILDPESALSFATATFTVDAGIENYATSYYTTTSQVARTGTRNNLTFIAPVIKEAVVNNITNTYVTQVTNEYVTNNYSTNTYVNNQHINNDHVPGQSDSKSVKDVIEGTKTTRLTPIVETKSRDEGGTSGGKTTPGGGTTTAAPVTKDIYGFGFGGVLPPGDLGQGKNTSADTKNTKPQDNTPKTGGKDNKQDTFQGGPLAGAPVSAGFGNSSKSSADKTSTANPAKAVTATKSSNTQTTGGKTGTTSGSGGKTSSKNTTSGNKSPTSSVGTGPR